MVSNNRNQKQKFDTDRPTDMEIALQLSMHLDDPSVQGHTDRIILIRLAEDALKGMKNPFAKEFLMKKVNEHKATRDSGFI